MTNKIISMLLLCGMSFAESSAQNPVNNFKVDVKVTQGIEDAGYLVHVFNNTQTQRKFVDKITVKDKRTYFETHIDEPLVGDLTAIFPDSTVCSACVRFPFVPGEEVHVKVKNGTFELSGTKFYQEWADADDLEENARKYYKQSETDSIIRNYLKNHANEEGCVMRYWQYNILPRPVILSMIPESMRNGRFKYFFEGYTPETDNEVVIEEAEDEPTVTTIEKADKTQRQSDGFSYNFEPTPTQKAQLQTKAVNFKSSMDAVEALYHSLQPAYEAKSFLGTDNIFNQIVKQNDGLDKSVQDLIKTLKSFNVPQTEETKMLGELYQEVVKFYTKQNLGYAELQKELGTLPKAAQKAQKSISKLAEKYMAEMGKLGK